MSQTSTQPQLFDTPFLPELGQQERMEVVFSSHGFLPHTKDELNEVISIDSFSPRLGGVALHLNEVLLHQKKADTDQPAQAVRSKTQEYAWYARQAHQDTRELFVLHSNFSQMLNPNLPLVEHLMDLAGEISPEEPSPQQGTRQLIRFIDLNTFRQTGRFPGQVGDILQKASRLRGKQGSREIIDRYTSTEDEAINSHIALTLTNTTPRDLRTKPGISVEDALDASISRFDYWTGVLQASEAHLVARPIARRALASLMVPDKKQG